MKKTIEEVAEEYAKDFDLSFYDTVEEIPVKEHAVRDFLAGAKYQSEQMYSDEDLREAFKAGQDYQNFDVKYAFNEWFNQFKKS